MVAALEASGWDRRRAMEHLGVSKSTLWRYLRPHPELVRLLDLSSSTSAVSSRPAAAKWLPCHQARDLRGAAYAPPRRRPLTSAPRAQGGPGAPGGTTVSPTGFTRFHETFR